MAFKSSLCACTPVVLFVWTGVNSSHSSAGPKRLSWDQPGKLKETHNGGKQNIKGASYESTLLISFYLKFLLFLYFICLPLDSWFFFLILLVFLLHPYFSWSSYSWFFSVPGSTLISVISVCTFQSFIYYPIFVTLFHKYVSSYVHSVSHDSRYFELFSLLFSFNVCSVWNHSERFQRFLITEIRFCNTRRLRMEFCQQQVSRSKICLTLLIRIISHPDINALRSLESSCRNLKYLILY